MTRFSKSLFPVASLLVATGVAFCLEPQQGTRPLPATSVTDESATLVASSQKKKTSAPSNRRKFTDQAAEQDAFLDDLLSDTPSNTKGKSKTSVRESHPKNSRQKQQTSIPNLSTEPVSTDSSHFSENGFQEKNVTPMSARKQGLESSVVETSKVIETPKIVPLIPLAHLAPDELLAPQITLNWHVDGPLTLGQETTCRLIVRNPGRIVAQQVSVDARLGDQVKLVATDPEARNRDNQLTWDLGNLQPDAEIVLETTIIPQAPGELPVSAIIRLGSGGVTRFLVEEPLLAVKISGSESVISGELWTPEVQLLNPGTGAVKAAKIEATLPEGMTHEGSSTISLEVGEIPAGESRKIELPLVCSGKGERLLLLKASGDSVPARDSELSCQVLAPELQLETSGPNRRFVSRPAQYKLALQNQGNTSADNAKVVCIVPAGFELKEIGQGGEINPDSNTITWTIPTIGAGEACELTLDAVARTTGDQIFLVRAKSDHGGEASATCQTKVEGITSVAMSIRDLDDPIEVGVETGYEITLQNDGTQVLHDLEMICEIPPEIEFLSGTGPTAVSGERGQIRIANITELSPSQDLVYQIKVRGAKEGNFRLRAKLVSPELNKPVLAEELTRIYED